MKENIFPPGWDKQRVREILQHYEAQTEEEALAEDEDRADIEASERALADPERIPYETVRKRLGLDKS